MAERPQAREAQRVLAEEVATWVHGAEATERAKQASLVLFGKAEPAGLDERTLLDATAELPSAEARVGDAVVDVLVSLGLEKGAGAARRTIAGGGVYINNVKVEDAERVIDAGDVLPGSLVLLRKGKKNLTAIRVL